MKLSLIKDFLYRQKQRFHYHFTNDAIQKRIAEINQYEENVIVSQDGYLVKGADILLPKEGFDFVFRRGTFELFVSFTTKLNGKYSINNGILLFSFDVLTVEINSLSDIYILNEIFVEECYRFALPTSEVHVIDIGMNVGLASMFFARLPYVKKIHSFEPFIPTYQQAQKNLHRNPKLATKIETFNFGLGDVEVVLTAAYNDTNTGINGSITQRIVKDSSSSETLQIKPALDVINSILLNNPATNFVLKIDTEGAEYAIFRSLFSQTLSARIKIIIVEWHFHGAGELERILLENGFAFTSHILCNNSGLVYAFR